MTYRKLHQIGSALLVLFTLISLTIAAISVAAAQEPAPASCKTAILIWVDVNGAEMPMLRADKEYGDRATCIVNMARREGAATILGFRASTAGMIPTSRCVGVRETLAAEGVAPGDLVMSAAAINEAYGEEICPPDPSIDAGAGTPPAIDPGAGVPGGG